MKFKTVNALWKNLIFMTRCGANLSMILYHCQSVAKEELISRKHARAIFEYAELSRDKKFSEDWFSGNIPHWVDAFEWCGIDRNDDLYILEIGSFQGRSALFFAEYFPLAKIDCVDTWAGSDEHEENDAVSALEDVFKTNLKGYSNLQMHIMTSWEYFLNSDSAGYDIIYVDGSHRATDVLLDLVSSFYRLRRGGLLMLDDYLWKHYGKAYKNPCTAINAFYKIFETELEVVRFGYQVYLRKH